MSSQKEDVGIHFNYRLFRSFPGFLDAIQDLKCRELSLSNLAFNYRPRPGKKEYTFWGETLKFNNVSPDFLSSFFSSVNLNPETLCVLEISRCTIPSIAQRIEMDPEWSYIMLQDIPFYKAPSSPSSRTSYQISENSLYNAIEMCSSTEIYFAGCEGVVDDLFEWMCGEDDYLPAMSLTNLNIEDCPGFTSGALRNFLATRETMGRPLAMVEVYGKSPMISKDDAAWFLNGNEITTKVVWKVERDPNMPKDMVSDLFIPRRTQK